MQTITKQCPRCQQEMFVDSHEDLTWPATPENYEARVNAMLALVHCDECVAALDHERTTGAAHRKARAAKAMSYDSGWLLRDTEHHTFKHSNYKFENRTADIETAFEWGKTWTPKIPKNCAYVQGTKGAGKSYFCHCVLNSALSHGLTAREVQAKEIQDHAMDFEKRRAAAIALGHIKRVGCLLIEEVGIVNWTEYGLTELRNVIDYRYRNHLPTLMTSNFSAEDQRLQWNARCNNKSIVGPMIDRMQYFVRFKFEAESLRKFAV